MEPMAGPSRTDRDADLLDLTTHQLLLQYVDEIFSDYLERTVTLPEVVDEIKSIIETLVPHAPAALAFGRPD